MTNKQKKLMIIGSSWEQIPLIQKAKEMGCHVLGTDSNEHAEGFNFVDQSEVVSPRDLETLYKIAKNYSPDGITADECDYSHFAAVYVSELLGLKNDGIEAAQNTTNKYIMRGQALEGRIFQPRFFSCYTLEQAKKAVDSIGWPVVVKPHDNRGAYGVNIAYSKNELKAAFLDAVMHSHSRFVIIESYIEGVHITVDGCLDQKGNHHNLAIASKRTYEGSRPIINEVIYPAEISEENKKLILDVNTNVINALNIKSGLTHSEYILDEQSRCFLVETANRGGGVWTSGIIVPILSGINLSELLINNALDQNFSLKTSFWKGHVSLKFIKFAPGKIKNINGFESALNIAGVEALRLNFKVGDVIASPKSGGSRHGFVIIKSKNIEEMNDTFKKIMNTINIQYE